MARKCWWGIFITLINIAFVPQRLASAAANSQRFPSLMSWVIKHLHSNGASKQHRPCTWMMIRALLRNKRAPLSHASLKINQLLISNVGGLSIATTRSTTFRVKDDRMKLCHIRFEGRQSQLPLFHRPVEIGWSWPHTEERPRILIGQSVGWL